MVSCEEGTEIWDVIKAKLCLNRLLIASQKRFRAVELLNA
jgi:hypothetical protein